MGFWSSPKLPPGALQRAVQWAQTLADAPPHQRNFGLRVLDSLTGSLVAMKLWTEADRAAYLALPDLERIASWREGKAAKSVAALESLAEMIVKKTEEVEDAVKETAGEAAKKMTDAADNLLSFNWLWTGLKVLGGVVAVALLAGLIWLIVRLIRAFTLRAPATN